MIYLILAVVTSALIAIAMRLSEARVKSVFGMFLVNYLVCLILSRLTAAVAGDASVSFEQGFREPGILLATLLGTACGIIYLYNFFMLRLNIRRSGVVLPSTFMRLGVVIPILMAMIFFHETPSLPQIIGIALAISAIFLIQDPAPKAQTDSGPKDLKRTAKKTGADLLLLLLLLLGGGMGDSMSNIFDKLGNAALKDHFLAFTFLAAFVLSVVVVLVRREKIGRFEILFGLLLGIPNYFCSRFLLLSLGSVPAVIVYPVFSVATFVLITLFSLFVFREKLSPRKWAAMGVILTALVLLNL